MVAALVAACSESGIVGPSAPVPAALGTDAAVERVVAAADSAASSAMTLASLGAQAAQGPMTNGANHTGAIVLAGQTDSWTFNATQGDFLVVSIGELSGTTAFVPWIRVFAPNGTLVANSWNATAAQAALAAPATGSYTVVVASGDAANVGVGTYVLTLAAAPGTIVVPSGDEGGNMTNGLTYAGNLPVGDVDQWKFSATQGDYVVVSMGETAGTADFTPWIRVISPSGAVVSNTWNALVAQGGFQAPLTGTYTVIATTGDAGNDGTGSYTMTLAKGPGPMQTSVGDQGGNMSNGLTYTGNIGMGDVDQWKFNATQGDFVALSMGEVTGEADFTPWVRVVAPNGAVVGNSWNAAAAQVGFAATLTGTYTVIVASGDAGNDATGSYQLTLAKGPGAMGTSAGDQGGNMTNGALHTGSISLGDLDQWKFSASQGDFAVVSMGEVSGSAEFTPWIRVVAPNGAVVGNSWNAAAAQAGFTAGATGTYTVIVASGDAGNAGTGSYRLTLAKAPGTFSTSSGDQGGAIANGANKNGAIVMGDVDMYRFTATQGSFFSVSMAEASGTADFTPWVRVVAPNGAVVVNSWNASVAMGSATASVAGTYTVIVGTGDSGNDATGNYRLTLVQAPGAFAVPTNDQGGAMTPGTMHTGAITLGDLDPWSFSAATGGSVVLTVTETSGNASFTPWIRLVSPTGAVVGNNWGATGATITVNGLTSGSYTVIVASGDAGNLGTGNYRVTVTGVGISSVVGGSVVGAESGQP